MILLFAGLELVSIVRDIGNKKEDVYVILFTAVYAPLNMGVAFVAGMALYYALRKGIVRTQEYVVLGVDLAPCRGVLESSGKSAT